MIESRIGGLSVDQCGISTSDSGSEAQGMFNLMLSSSSDTSLVETSESSGRSSEAGSDAHNKFRLSTTTTDQSAGQAFIERAVDSSRANSPLPFDKCSSLWESIESMEVFYKMPQRPHFRTLQHYRRDFREGMAIGLMVTFSTVVSSIGKLEISDHRRKFDEVLKTLAQLEVHGFHVQCICDRVLELIKMKEIQDQLVDERSTLEKQLGKEKRENELLNLGIESMKCASVGLGKCLSYLYKEKTCVPDKNGETKGKMDSLEMDSRRIEDTLVVATRDFEAIRSASW